MSRYLALLWVGVSLAACVTPIEFNGDSTIGSIALLTVEEPDEYHIEVTSVGEALFVATAAAGGGVLGAVMAQSAAARGPEGEVSAEIAHQNVKLGAELTAALRERLGASGFDIEMLDVAPRANNFLQDYMTVPTGADAVLDANITFAGFVDDPFGDFTPIVVAKARLVVPQTNTVLFAREYHYSDKGGLFRDTIPIPEEFLFDTYEDALADPVKIGAALRAAIPIIADDIAASLMPN